MRTYISPIGFNSTSVTRPVLSRGIDTGDTVVLLRPTMDDDSRAREAIADVERLLQEVEPDVVMETERITHEDFQTAVLECSDVIRAAEAKRIVNLGGGARDLLLPFAFAAITHVSLLDTALFFSDLDGAVQEWPLPDLTPRVPETVTPTLAAIAAAEEGVSIPTLTTETEQSKSTVTRHVSRLADGGFVETWQEGKTKFARSTLTGQLAMKTRE